MYEKLEVNVLTLTEEKAQLQEELEFIKGNSTNGNNILLCYYTVYFLVFV